MEPTSTFKTMPHEGQYINQSSGGKLYRMKFKNNAASTGQVSTIQEQTSTNLNKIG